MTTVIGLVVGCIAGVLVAAYLRITEVWRRDSPDAVPAPLPPLRQAVGDVEDLGYCAGRRLDEVDALEALYQLPAAPTGTEIP